MKALNASQQTAEYSEATIVDLQRIVDTHMTAFPDFFLSQLGPAFVREMYAAFLDDSHCIFVSAKLGDSVVGFAVGAMAGGRRDLKLALKRLPRFLKALIPALRSRPIWLIRRLIHKIVGREELVAVSARSVTLRSIAVHPNWQGGLIARGLLNSFERIAALRGADNCILTTDAEANERVNRFYIREGYEAMKTFYQYKDRSMILYRKSIISAAQDSIVGVRFEE